MEKFYKYILILLSLAICTGLFSQTNSQTNSLAKPKDFITLPDVKWKFKATQPFFSSPVIDGNIVYSGNLDGNLYALDLKSGDVKWKFKTGGEIRSTISISENKLFLTSGDGNLYALEKSNGKVIWAFKASDKKYDTYDYHQSSPVLYNNMVCFGMGNGKVYAVNVNDGKEVWSYQTGDVVHSTPAILKDKLFIGSFDGNVYGLNTTDGNFLWKFKTLGHTYFPKGEVQFNPTAINVTVYIAARDYNMYAIDYEKGLGRWNREFPAGWATSISYTPERDSLIILGTSDPKHLFAINRATEKTYWEANLKSQVFGKCAFSESMVYVGTLNGKIFAVDINTGEVKWTWTTESYTENHLKYFNADDEYRDDILSILKTDEDFLTAGYDCGAIYSTAAITSNELIVSSTNGTIYSLGRK